MRSFLGQLIAFVLGTATGLVTPVIQRNIRRLRSRVRDRQRFNPLNFEARSVKFFMLNQWSDSRPLERQFIHQELRDPKPQTWCEESELERIKSTILDQGGPACSLVDLEIDHNESDRGRKFRVAFAPSMYGDFVAVAQYFSEHPEAVDNILDRLEREEVRQMVNGAPLSVVAVNVTVLSDDGYLLAIRRSGSVRTSQNVWTLGPNETMNLPNYRPGESEDFFRLAERCLREEVGIEPNADYGPIHFSWIGYNVPGAVVHIIAHVRSSLDRVAIEERLHRSHGAFESDQLAWIRNNRKSLSEIVQSHQQDSQGRRWIESAPLAAQQFWRRQFSIME